MNKAGLDFLEHCTVTWNSSNLCSEVHYITMETLTHEFSQPLVSILDKADRGDLCKCRSY
jgi:hypothetical protein